MRYRFHPPTFFPKAFLLCLWTVPLWAQTGQAPIPPRPQAEQVRTVEILVDVIVTDKNGDPVTDLRPEDFSLLENDTPQTIRSIWLEAMEEKKAADTTAEPPAGEMKVVRRPSSTMVTLLFDNLSMSPQSRLMAVRAAKEALERWPEDAMLCLFVMENRLSLLYPPNGDRKGLSKALEQVVLRNGRPYASSSTDLQRLLQSVPGTASENIAKARNAASDETDINVTLLQSMLQFEDMDREMQSSRSVLAILSLIRSQQAIPGRKTIILISDGFSITEKVQNQYQSLIGFANRNNVALYTIDAAGLRIESSDARSFQELSAMGNARRSGDPSMVRDGRSALGNVDSLARMDTTGVLKELSETTGGLNMNNSNDIASAFQRIRRDIGSYYMLSYRPTNTVYDGSFRKIQVKVNRPNVRLRTRSGYEALPYGNVGSQMDYEKPLWEAMTRDLSPAEIPMITRLWRFPAGPDRDFVIAQAAIPASVLTFAPASAPPPGKESKKKGKLEKFVEARLDAMAVLQNPKGYILDKKSRYFEIVSVENRVEEVRKADIDFSRSFVTPLEAGSAAFAARESGSGKLTVVKMPLPDPTGTAGNLRLGSLIAVRGIEPVKPDEDRSDPLVYEKSRILPMLECRFRKSTDPVMRFYFVVLTAPGSAPAIKLEFIQKGQVILESSGNLPAADAAGFVRFLSEFPSEPFSPGEYTLRAKVSIEKAICTQQQAFTLLP